MQWECLVYYRGLTGTYGYQSNAPFCPLLLHQENKGTIVLGQTEFTYPSIPVLGSQYLGQRVRLKYYKL